MRLLLFFLNFPVDQEGMRQIGTFLFCRYLGTLLIAARDTGYFAAKMALVGDAAGGAIVVQALFVKRKRLRSSPIASR